MSTMTAEYLKLKKSNCKNCYKCIRHCPVKSIRFDGAEAHIVANECILCGHCFVVCPQNAKEIRDDTATVLELIKSGAVATVAPSFAAGLKGVSFGALRSALKQLGFYDAYETALGATLVKAEYDNMLEKGERDVIITSCCSSVNLLIRKYYPEALEYLADVITPMEAAARLIKREHPDKSVVFIGPCISKKYECDEPGSKVDAAITFEELDKMLASAGIKLDNDSYTPEDGGRARIFPTNGGILKSMYRKSDKYSYLSIDGTDNCIETLKEVASGKLHNCFIEMSACVGSCIGGPAIERMEHTLTEDFLRVDRISGSTDFEVQSLDTPEMAQSQEFIPLERDMPGSAAIAEILKKMGKTKPEDELNCGSCGYNTCREKAIAVYQGKADLTMCLPFLKEKAESFSDTIIKNTPNGILVLDEQLAVQQINSAACEILGLRQPSDILGDQVIRILDPADFVTVLSDEKNIHDKPTYLAEYDKYVELTIIYDKSYHLLICLMRDITELKKQAEQKEQLRNETIKVTDGVVEKQMRVVQEIASLLGETTAETKIALTKLKESLESD